MSLAVIRSALAACLSVGAMDLWALNTLVLPAFLVVAAPSPHAIGVLTAALDPIPNPMAYIQQPPAETKARAAPAVIVEFVTSSRRVDTRASSALSAAFGQLRAAPFIRVVGHADAAGSLPLNERLSQKRAEAVARTLTRAGIAKARILLSWRGAREPRVEGDSKRVEVYLGEVP